MKVHAEIGPDGTLKITDQSLWGKSVILNLDEPIELEIKGQMNWPGFWKALEEIDQLNLPPLTQEEIMKRLGRNRES